MLGQFFGGALKCGPYLCRGFLVLPPEPNFWAHGYHSMPSQPLNAMRILIGCEFSGVVRRAFAERGHEAWSCDLLPPEDNSDHHLQCDVLDAIQEQKWDMAIFHPPCTYLCSSGLHWNKRRPERALLTHESILFFFNLIDADIPKIAIENPIGCMSTHYRKPDQIIQPWQFGHPDSKSTCLWLKNLPLLQPTKVLSKPESGRWNNQTPTGQNKLGPSATRWAERSRTYEGIALAMALQWG